jgi:hypothetical protein
MDAQIRFPKAHFPGGREFRVVSREIEAVLTERFLARGRKRSQAVAGLRPRPLTLPLPKIAGPFGFARGGHPRRQAAWPMPHIGPMSAKADIRHANADDVGGGLPGGCLTPGEQNRLYFAGDHSGRPRAGEARQGGSRR